MRRFARGRQAIVVATTMVLAATLPAVVAKPAHAETVSVHATTSPVSSSTLSGYRLVASDGGVFSFGTSFYGSTGAISLNRPVVGMATALDGLGYYLVASDGGIFTFGSASYLGSTGSQRLNKPIVGMAVDPATGGYWMVASDGGVFSFGAPFYGSTGAISLNKPVVGMAATPDGLGYYLVASDGGIFTFGDAHFAGSTGSQRLNKPIVGMAVDPATGGYWMVASDGGVFSFGAPFYGSTGGISLNKPVVGMSTTPDGSGYYLVASDGGIFTFGDARFAGSTGSQTLNRPIVGMSGPGTLVDCPYRPLQVQGDPYSPACVDFSGTNGGTTSLGVSPTAVTVAYRLTSTPSFGQAWAQLAGAQLPDSTADTERTVLALAQYFNSHFEFYGRQLNVVFYNGQGSLTDEIQGQGQNAASADAATVAGNIRAFADLSAQSQLYADALASHGVVALGSPWLTPADISSNAPHEWSVFGTEAAEAANYTVAKLCPAGTPAAYAGGSLKNVARRFAIIAAQTDPFGTESAQISQIMTQRGCGSDSFQYQIDLGTESQQAINLVSQLKAGTYTSVICVCDPAFMEYLSGHAASQSYFPEVVVPGDALTDSDYVGQLWDQQFAAHILGVSANGPALPASQTAGYAAYRTVRSDEPAAFVDLIYQQLEMLAIGIQLAGPNLNPTTFEQGMFGYGSHQGANGLWQFGPGQFTAPLDAREVCWDTTAVSAANGRPGAYISPAVTRFSTSVPAGLTGCPIPP